MTVSKLSAAVAEQAVTDKMDELDALLTSQTEQLKGLRDSLINYIAVTKQIIKESGESNEKE